MTVIKIVAMPGVGVEGPQGPTGKSAYQTAVDNGFEGTEQEWIDSLGSNVSTGNFVFNNNEMSTNEEMIITVNTVPGSITASAYNGLELQFADAPGAGLRFPDGSIQTTAYAGGTESPKNWTAESGGLYSIRQAHGGIEVTLDQPLYYVESITVVGSVTNSSTLTVSAPSELSGYMNDIYSNGVYFRRLSMDFAGQTRNFRIAYPTSNENEWVIEPLDGLLTTYNGNSYYVTLEYGGAPVVWWDADNLGFMPEGEEWKFRGAKIDYHAYSTDSGTIVGTIYIANDNGDNYVTHIETSSGANDTGNVVLWNRSGGEQQLYAYRADNEDDTVKIHWTAQVYYGTEYYD